MSKLATFTEAVRKMPEFLYDRFETDEIIIGDTCTHIFKLPFNYYEAAKSAKVIYKQGLEVKLIVDITDDMIHLEGNNSVLYVYLPKVYTSLFEETVLDTYCQLEVRTKNNEILHDEPHKLRVYAPLNLGAQVMGVSNVIINGKSVVNENGVAEFTVVKDFSDVVLVSLDQVDFASVVEKHYAIINENINMPVELFDYTDATITVNFVDTEYIVRLVRTTDFEMSGTLVVTLGQSIYDMLIKAALVNNRPQVVIRSANIY